MGISERIDIAVVGTGVMGTNHLRVLSRMSEAQLIGVVDTDLDRAQVAADSANTHCFQSLEELITAFGSTEGQKAAVVTTPTSSHLSVATALAKEGIHILVEKPVASTIAEATELKETTEKAEVLSMVGHIERFNPVVVEVLRPGYQDVLHLDIRRIGPFSARVLDNVIDDLMIHDLDIARQIARSPLVDVRAIARVERSSTYDMATALLTFESGITASLTASRLGQKKVRSLELTLESAVVSGDLLHQTVAVHRSESTGVTPDGTHRHAQTSAEELPFLTGRAEPLAEELGAFLGAIRNEKTSPIPLDEGIEAMHMAKAVHSALTS